MGFITTGMNKMSTECLCGRLENWDDVALRFNLL